MSEKTLPRQAHKSLIKKMLGFDATKKYILDELGCLVVGVGILKGGTGKTTSAIYIALYLAVAMDLKVAFVDTDDNSQSAENWVGLRTRTRLDKTVAFDLHLFKNRKEDEPDLEEFIEALKKNYDAVVVDIGGGDKEAYAELCRTAHLLVIPTAPSGYETNRVGPSLKLAIKQAPYNTSGTGLDAYVVMIKTANNNGLAREQRAAIEAQLEILDQVDALVPVEFQISGKPHYPRSWETTPKRSDLDEFGNLLRYMLKGLAA